MAHVRTSPGERAHREFALLKTMLGATFAVLLSASFTGAANAPDGGVPKVAAVLADTASLTRAGTDLIITGSIDHIFSSGSFAGPNRPEKRDRARPLAEVIEVARDFDAIRAKIAALRNPAAPAAIAPVAVAAAPADPEARISLASIAPDFATPALEAIDGIATVDDGVPVPRSMSTKLAYARADLPATVFDGSVKNKHGKKVSDKEVWCMATAIYFEARGESYRGQVAVGQVVMNRVAHRLYPSTICGVVFQNQSRRNACQFSFACDRIPERINDQKSWDQAMEIAKLVIPGSEYLTEVGYSTHYHATYVYPHWAPRMKKNTKIGLHVFYQFKRGWKFG